MIQLHDTVRLDDQSYYVTDSSRVWGLPIYTMRQGNRWVSLTMVAFDVYRLNDDTRPTTYYRYDGAVFTKCRKPRGIAA